MNRPLEIQEGVLNPGALRATCTPNVRDEYKTAPQAKKKLQVQYKKQSFYTKPLSESFFAEQKRENGAAGKIFFKVQPWAARNYFSFSFLSAVRACPSAPTQCTLLPPWWRALAALQEARFPRRLQSHAPYCIIIYSVVREVKGRDRRKRGGDFFCSLWLGTALPGQSASYSQPHGAGPTPQTFSRKINFPRIKSLEKIIFPPCKILRKNKIKSKSGPGHPL